MSGQPDICLTNHLVIWPLILRTNHRIIGNLDSGAAFIFRTMSSIGSISIKESNLHKLERFGPGPGHINTYNPMRGKLINRTVEWPDKMEIDSKCSYVGLVQDRIREFLVPPSLGKSHFASTHKLCGLISSHQNTAPRQYTSR